MFLPFFYGKNMPNQFLQLFDSLYKDPDFMPELSNDNRRKEAFVEAKSRLAQMENTKKALSMVKANALPPPGEQHAFDMPKMPKLNTPKIPKVQPMEEPSNETAGERQTAPPPQLADLSMDQLEEHRKNLDKMAKDWEGRGFRNISHLYRTKMFDVDQEINRRAKDEEKKFLGSNFFDKAWGGMPSGMPPHPGLVWKPTTHRWVKPGTRDMQLLPLGTVVELPSGLKATVVGFDAGKQEYTLQYEKSGEKFTAPMRSFVQGQIKVLESPDHPGFQGKEGSQ